MNLFTLCIICFAADKLRTEVCCLLIKLVEVCIIFIKIVQSSQFFDEICKTNWYELKPHEVKVLVIMLGVSQVPFELTAGKFITLSLSYFMKVSSTTIL